MTLRIGDVRSLAAGVLFLGIGAFAVAVASGYRMGSALHMGPGYYPVAIGVLLAVAGIGAILRSLVVTGMSTDAIAWRPAVTIAGAVMAFALLVDRAGLLPATAAAIVIAGLAARPLRIRQTLVLAVLLPLSAAAIFVYGLKLPFTLFG